MSGAPRTRRLACPRCGATLAEPNSDGDIAELVCPGCGETLRARRRFPATAPSSPITRNHVPQGLHLSWRVWKLVTLERIFNFGNHFGAVIILICGGFVPVLRHWLNDDLDGWSGVLTTLGGVRVEPPHRDPDADLGPVLARADAPSLFDEINHVARHLGVRPPRQIRVSYLPCCGAVAWGRRDQALILGLPLLYVLTRAELRAILAHELAHLARGDATRAARAVRFVQALDQALVPGGSGPLGVWAHVCGHLGRSLIEPVAIGQELRADRAAADLVGAERTASALLKTALVQPLFREVLDHYAPTDSGTPTLYAFFRDFWRRLPDPLLTAMRHRLLSQRGPAASTSHPELLDRLDALRTLPEPATTADHDADPAAAVIGDLDALEHMLHNRLFATTAPEPTVFHRAGS